MKLHLMPRKLIINKITSMKAITDNNCLKEVLRCVWSRGGHRLIEHSALFPWDGPPKDKELGQTKTLLARFWKLFFVVVVSHGVYSCHAVACSVETNRKKNTSASKHGFIMSMVQIDEKAIHSVIPFKV